MRAWLIFTTTPDKKAARKLAEGLVKGKLAACVTQLDSARSVYRWKGRLTSLRETLLIIKTTGQKLKALEVFLKKAHPYDLPEFIALPIKAGSRDYLAWLEEGTR